MRDAPERSPELYDLAELCDHAGVTPRTVRYYIQQGLLAPPIARGPGARYDRGHLDRLRAIRRLQHEHLLPLAEIRRRVEGLDEGALRALAEGEGEPTRTSALAYVRELLAPPAPAASAAAQAAASAAAPLGAPPGAPRATRAPAPPPSPAPGAPHGAAEEPSPYGAPRSTWERITLDADVELHVRRPLSRLQNRRVDRLVALARTLFEEEA